MSFTTKRTIILLACVLTCAWASVAQAGSAIEDILKQCPTVKSFQQHKQSDGSPDPNYYTLDIGDQANLEFMILENSGPPSVKYVFVSGFVKGFSEQPSNDTLALIPGLNEQSTTKPGSISMYSGQNADNKGFWNIYVNYYLPYDTDARTLDSYIALAKSTQKQMQMQFTFAK